MKFQNNYSDLTLAAIIPITARVLAGVLNYQTANIVLPEALALAFISVLFIYLIPYEKLAYHKYLDGNSRTWVVKA